MSKATLYHVLNRLVLSVCHAVREPHEQDARLSYDNDGAPQLFCALQRATPTADNRPSVPFVDLLRSMLMETRCRKVLFPNYLKRKKLKILSYRCYGENGTNMCLFFVFVSFFTQLHAAQLLLTR